MDIPSQAIGFGKLGRNATEIGFAAHLKLKSFFIGKRLGEKVQSFQSSSTRHCPPTGKRG